MWFEGATKKKRGDSRAFSGGRNESSRVVRETRPDLSWLAALLDHDCLLEKQKKTHQ